MKINFHDPNELADPSQNSIQLLTGSKHEIKLTPSSVKVDQSFESLSFTERQCKLSQEAEGLELMKVYTQESCKLEKFMASSFEAQQCKPRLYASLFPSHEVCKRKNPPTGTLELADYYKFNSKLKASHIEERIFRKLANTEEDSMLYDTCPGACQSTKYKYEVASKPLDVKAECMKLKLTSLWVNGTLRYSHTLEGIIEKESAEGKEMMTLMLESLQEDSSCLQLLRDTAVIHIRPGVSQVNVIIQRKSVSFSSQLAIFGEQIILVSKNIV